MYNVPKEVKRCREGIRRLEHELVDLRHQREEWLLDERKMYQDYPRWRHIFYRTPMDWINAKIDWMIPDEIKCLREKLDWLCREKRAWFESEYYNMVSDDDIKETVDKIGYIVCIKL